MPLETLPGVPTGRIPKKTYKDRPVKKRARIIDENEPFARNAGSENAPPGPPGSGENGRPASKPALNLRALTTLVSSENTATADANAGGNSSNISSTVVPASKKRMIVKTKIVKPAPKIQTTLAFGQKTVKSCEVCSCTYRIGVDEDKVLHESYHAKFLQTTVLQNAIRRHFTQIQNGMLMYRISSSIGGASSESTAAGAAKAKRWILDLVRYVEQAIGAVKDDWDKDGAKIFIKCIPSSEQINGSQVIGILVAEHIRARPVYPVTSTSAGVVQVDRDQTLANQVMGIARIWVLESKRRTGVGKNLLNAAKDRFFLGAPLNVDQVAFSQPTQSGMELAKKFFGRPIGWGVYESTATNTADEADAEDHLDFLVPPPAEELDFDDILN